MNAAAVATLYTEYKRFNVSRVKYWQPKIYADLKQMIRNATNESSVELAIRRLDENMLKPSGLAATLTSVYKDAGRVWGARIYQTVKKQAASYERRAASNSKRLLPIGYNAEIIAEISAYFRLHLLDRAVLPITETMKDYILRQLLEAQQTGNSITNVANDMIGRDDFTKNRSYVIARTETMKAANVGAVTGAKKTGFEMEKEWIAARDHRTRRIPRDEYSHFIMHGKTVPMDQPFYVPNRNGGFDDIMQPGDPATGEAGDVIQCRCTVGFNVMRDARGLPMRADGTNILPGRIAPPVPPVMPPVIPAKPVFKPAATIKEAKEYVTRLFTERYGLNIKSVSASREMTVDKFNTYNEKIFNITNEYNIAEVYQKDFGTKLKFASTESKYGFVKTFYWGKQLDTVNFGHTTDSGPGRTLDLSAKLIRDKSRVDAENLDVATVVHEFAHVIGTSRQTVHGNPVIKGFFNELEKLEVEYHKTLSELYKSGDTRALQLFSLGRYANTKLNEFMAEGFTEYKLSSNPSEYALKIGRLIDKYFKK